MISFPIMVGGGWILLMTMCIGMRAAGRPAGSRPWVLPSKKSVLYLDAAFLFWTVLALFFLDSLTTNTFLVPGDILLDYYPWKGVFPDKAVHNPLLADIVNCVYPWMGEIKKSFLAGELPLWNPYAYSGSPLAGNQVSAVFHPFNLLLFVMPLADAATFFPFLRLFIAAMGMFCLLTSWHLSRRAAVFGALVFAFCGVHISWLANYPEVSVTMLIPWIILALDKIAVQGSPNWWVGFIFLSVVQFLGGHVETSFHLYAWAVPFFFIRLFHHKKTTRQPVLLKRTLLVVSAGILSLGISAFQLLPFLEYLPLTTRMHQIAGQGGNLFLGLDFVQVFVSAAATLISPDFFGNPVAGNYWGSFNYIEQNTHLTITGLFFALAAVAWKSEDHQTRFLKMVFLAGGLSAFVIAVRFPGIFEFVVSLPLFKHNSNHRLIIIFSFAFAILSAFGINDLVCRCCQKPLPPVVKKTSAAPKNYGLVVKGILVAAGLLVTACLLHLYDARALTLDQLHYRWQQIHKFLIFLGAAVFVFYCMVSARFSRMKQYMPVLAIGLVVVEVFVWGKSFNPFVPGHLIFPPTPLTEFITSRPGVYRVASTPDTLPHGTELYFSFDSISGVDPMKTHAYERIFAQIANQYNSIYTGTVTSFASPWIDFLNVRYVAAPPGTRKTDLGRDDLVPVYEGTDGVVYENPQAFARVFRVNQVVMAPDNARAFDIICNNEHRLDSLAVVEKQFVRSGSILSRHVTDYRPVPDNVLDKASRRMSAPDQADPLLITRKNHEMVFDFSGTDPGFYVAAMQYYPGWKLDIDGENYSLVRANSAFMGFWVPEGARQVKLYYDPASFYYGLWISVFFCLAAAGCRFVLEN